MQYLKDAAAGIMPVDSGLSKLRGGINDSTSAKNDEEDQSVGDTDVVAGKLKQLGDDHKPKSPSHNFYTIRPLSSPEATDFSTPTVTSHTGITPLQLLQKSLDEGWIGMRVDLCEGDLLVKVQYWWRWERIAAGEEMESDVGGMGWRQCLHDIVYLGARDGKEWGGEVEIRE